MQTTVTFTVESKTGNVSRITSAIKRLGFKVGGVKIQRVPNQSTSCLVLAIDAQRALTNRDFASLRASIPQIIAIDVNSSLQTQSQLAPLPPSLKRSASQPHPTRLKKQPPTSRALAPTAAAYSKLTSAPKVTTPVSVPAPKPVLASKSMTESEKAAFVKSHGRRIAGEYPDIYSSLVALETEFVPTVRKELLMKIGTALGQWQHKKVYSHNGRMNKTVKKSLKIQDAHFKGLPVIAGLVSLGNKKHNDLVDADPMTQIGSVLSKFLQASTDGVTVTVGKCPHCSAERTTTELDCYFIRGFIEGFLMGNKELKGMTAHQLTSVATGSLNCVFEIREKL